MSVNLTRDMIPSGATVLSFVPGAHLRMRVSLPAITRAIYFTFSLFFYLIAAQGVSFVVSVIFGSHQFISFGCNVAATLVCVLMNIRGVVLTIFLGEPKYRLSSPVSWAVCTGVPKAEVATTSRAGRWISTLSVAEQAITSNASEISAAEAKRPFAAFIAAFQRPAAVTAVVDQRAESLASGSHPLAIARTRPAPLRPGRPRACPVVILVHGTWGQQSTWTFPEKSLLVSALESRLAFDVEYRRFCWSGANRTGARMEAAARLAAMVRSELADQDRIIFVLAHSHGGNIAVRAIGDLSDAEQRNVRAILMATPFLWSGHRFDVRDLYTTMPRFIQQNLFGFCGFGFWFGAFVLIGILQRFLPADIQIDGYLSGHFETSFWQLPLVLLYFFGPFILFNVIWRKGVASLNAVRSEDSGLDQKEISRDPSQLLTIAYNQDEAFQILSLLINLLGLVHQIAFLAILGIARTRFVDEATGFSMEWCVDRLYPFVAICCCQYCYQRGFLAARWGVAPD